MRYAFKSLVICLFLFVSVNTLSAQSSLNIGVNVDAGTNSFPSQGKRGFGGAIEYVPKVWKNGGVRIVVAYDWFNRRMPKNINPQLWQDSLKFLGVSSMDVSFLPIRIGYEQLFWSAVLINGEVGVTQLITQQNYSGNKSLFSHALGVGHRFFITDKKYLQASCNYNYNRLSSNANLNYFSFKLAYGFLSKKLKK